MEVFAVQRNDRLIVDRVVVDGQPERGPRLRVELVSDIEADGRRTRVIADLDLRGKLRAVELPGGDLEVLPYDVVLRSLREQLRIADLAQQVALLGAVRPLEPRQVDPVRPLRSVRGRAPSVMVEIRVNVAVASDLIVQRRVDLAPVGVCRIDDPLEGEVGVELPVLVDHGHNEVQGTLLDPLHYIHARRRVALAGRQDASPQCDGPAPLGRCGVDRLSHLGHILGKDVRFLLRLVVLEVVRPEGPVDFEPVDVVLVYRLLDQGEPLGSHLRVRPVEGVFPTAFQAPFGVVDAKLPVEHPPNLVLLVRRVGRMRLPQGTEELDSLLVRTVDQDLERIETALVQTLDVLVRSPARDQRKSLKVVAPSFPDFRVVEHRRPSAESVYERVCPRSHDLVDRLPGVLESERWVVVVDVRVPGVVVEEQSSFFHVFLS